MRSCHIYFLFGRIANERMEWEQLFLKLKTGLTAKEEFLLLAAAKR